MSDGIIIKSVIGREILDSRGNPTVEVDVVLSDESIGRAAVPSGASTGKYEAVEFRHRHDKRFGGAATLGAVTNNNAVLGTELAG